MKLVSIDPGVRACGVALWKDGILQRALYVRGYEEDEEVADGILWNIMRDKVVAAYTDSTDGWNLAIELPQTYGGRSGKGDTNDLIRLAAVVGAIVVGFPLHSTTVYRPREWKGQVEKQVMNRRVAAALSEIERKRVELPRAKSLHHNVFDGIGIGMFHLRKIGERPRDVVAVV